MSTRYVTKFIAGLLVLTVGLFLSYTIVGAQEDADSSSFTISKPLYDDLNANPGDSLSNTIRVTNNTSRDRTLSVDTRTFTAAGEEGGVELSDEESSFDIASWTSVDPAQATIPANSSQTFEFTIDVPADAEPGGHYGAVVFKTDVEDVNLSETGAKVGQEFVSLILLTVAGDIEKSVSIVGFDAGGTYYNSDPIVEFSARFENTGNVHDKPTGTITIKNMFGQETASILLNEQNVLPGSIRDIVTEWRPGFGLGRYTADLSATFGNTGEVITDSTSFVLFPYRTVLPVAVAVAAVAFVGIRYRDRFANAVRALSGK